MYGHQLIGIFERLHDLELTDSRNSFSIQWCGRSRDLLRDYDRRNGAYSKVNQHVVIRLRQRLAEAATLVPDDIAAQIREIDAAIVRDLYVANLLGRRSVR